jgi:hypothetical protein
VSIADTVDRRRDGIQEEEALVQFMALIYGDASRWEEFSPDEREAVYERYRAFADDAGKAGVMVAGGELASTRDVTTVRVRSDETLVTDGPYAEVKEALGGYFLLECDSIDEAIDYAAKIPGAEHGAIEVRPVYVDPNAEGAAS